MTELSYHVSFGSEVACIGACSVRISTGNMERQLVGLGRTGCIAECECPLRLRLIEPTPMRGIRRQRPVLAERPAATQHGIARVGARGWNCRRVASQRSRAWRVVFWMAVGLAPMRPAAPGPISAYCELAYYELICMHVSWQQRMRCWWSQSLQGAGYICQSIQIDLVGTNVTQ